MMVLEHMSETQKAKVIPVLQKYIDLIEAKGSVISEINAELVSSGNETTAKMSALTNKLQCLIRNQSDIMVECKSVCLRMLDHAITIPVVPFIELNELQKIVRRHGGQYITVCGVADQQGNPASIYLLFEADYLEALKDALRTLGYVDSDIEVFDKGNPPQTILLAGVSNASEIDAVKKYIDDNK